MTLTAVIGTVVTPPSLQSAVDRFTQSLATPHKLLQLHPRAQGHPGNAAALAPAIVLGTIAAFEGFAEDFTAIALAHEGASFAEIAKKVGAWNNPHLADLSNYLQSNFPLAASAIGTGASIEVFGFTNSSSQPHPRLHDWGDILKESRSRMQVRHHLTHGLTTGWRSERWFGPLRSEEPPAAAVLRAMRGGKHSLTVYGAISCARIYSEGARTIADGVASAYGHHLNWTAMPTFR